MVGGLKEPVLLFVAGLISGPTANRVNFRAKGRGKKPDWVYDVDRQAQVEIERWTD